ncbi:hypothetical protein C1931_07930 [Stenotrophomonas sp. YAU14A_MKIMI4_1]|nr:hypothetical protein C1931_07930 [Stenotrophomonas sp. YAU14A_MKIMI4_1]
MNLGSEPVAEQRDPTHGIASGAEPPESGGGREAAGVWEMVRGAHVSRSEAWERQRVCVGAYPGAARPTTITTMLSFLNYPLRGRR